MTSAINAAFLRLSKRAETNERESLIETFVDVGPLFTLLSSTDHQIVFGRRGTGKAHALGFLASSRERKGDVVVMIDLRNVGVAGCGDTRSPKIDEHDGVLAADHRHSRR